MWPNESIPLIELSDTKLSTYTGQRIRIVGAIDVDVEYHGQTAHNRLVIVDGDGPTRDWLRHFRLDWAKLHKIDSEYRRNLEELLSKHFNLFEPGLGTFAETTAN